MAMKAQRQGQGRGSRARAEPPALVVVKALESLVANGEPLGDFAVVNISTGEYVVAPSLEDAVDQFQTTFPGAKGFVHRVGEPVFEPLILK